MKKKKTKKKEKENTETYIKDLIEMAKSAWACEECEDCMKCENHTTCIIGLRNAVGDLAETLAWLVKEITKIDGAIVDLVNIIGSKKDSEDMDTPHMFS